MKNSDCKMSSKMFCRHSPPTLISALKKSPVSYRILTDLRATT